MFFYTTSATPAIYPLSLRDTLPISREGTLVVNKDPFEYRLKLRFLAKVESVADYGISGEPA